MKTSPVATTWWLGLAVAAVSTLWFASGVHSEPSFVDEWAYLSQAYFADLFTSGRHDDPAWLEYPGYDLPPLPKYQIGIALRLAGLPRPPREMMIRWYGDTSTKTGTTAMLMAARWPSVLWGGVGCAMIYAIGVQVSGRRLGILAAFFLALNPLYRLHARRAMSDVPAEALILATLAVGLWAYTRRANDSRSRRITLFITTPIVGILGGLAVLAKLNGSLALMTIGLWSLWDVAIAWSLRNKAVNPYGHVTRVALKDSLWSLFATAIAGLIGFVTFTILNPFMTAQPTGPLPPPIAKIAQSNLLERAHIVAQHRADVSTLAAKKFPHNALTRLDEKVVAVAIQGYGRFGPLGPSHTDSTKRFDLAQDWGAFLWLPLVAAGLIIQIIKTVSVRSESGKSSATPSPASGALALMVGLALVVVSGFIPLAWDRYYLSIQPGAVLLGASAIDWVIEQILRRR